MLIDKKKLPGDKRNVYFQYDIFRADMTACEILIVSINAKKLLIIRYSQNAFVLALFFLPNQ